MSEARNISGELSLVSLQTGGGSAHVCHRRVGRLPSYGAHLRGNVGAVTEHRGLHLLSARDREAWCCGTVSAERVIAVTWG